MAMGTADVHGPIASPQYPFSFLSPFDFPHLTLHLISFNRSKIQIHQGRSHYEIAELVA
jgi:hypothetical protein